MSDIDSEFELIWEAGTAAPPIQPTAAVRDPPRRQFKITRKRIPALQNEQIWLVRALFFASFFLSCFVLHFDFLSSLAAACFYMHACM